MDEKCQHQNPNTQEIEQWPNPRRVQPDSPHRRDGSQEDGSTPVVVLSLSDLYQIVANAAATAAVAASRAEIKHNRAEIEHWRNKATQLERELDLLTQPEVRRVR